MNGYLHVKYSVDFTEVIVGLFVDRNALGELLIVLSLVIQAMTVDLWVGAILGAVLGVLASGLVALFFKSAIALRNLRPVRRFLGDLLQQDQDCAIFVRWMRSPDPARPNYFVAPLPDYFPPQTTGQVSHHPNIPDVVAKSDMHATADVLNVLGLAGKTTNIDFLSVVEHYGTWDRNIICVGGTFKTNLIFDQDNQRTVWIAPGLQDSRLPAFYFPDRETPFEGIGTDYGLIYKTYYRNTGRICLIVMGLGVFGTEAAGYFLRIHAKWLGEMFGKKPFAFLVRARPTSGHQSAEPCWYYPEPTRAAKFFHPLVWNRRFRSLKRQGEREDGPSGPADTSSATGFTSTTTTSTTTASGTMVYPTE